MNKTTLEFPCETYKGSECWKNIEYNNDPEQLGRIKMAVQGAIHFHEGRCPKFWGTPRPQDIVFFKSALQHVDFKLTKTK